MPTDIASVFPGFEQLRETAILLKQRIEALHVALGEKSRLPDQEGPEFEAISTRIQNLATEIKNVDIKAEAFGSQDSLDQKIQDIETSLEQMKTALELTPQFDPRRPLGTNIVTMDTFTTQYLSEKTGIDLQDCFTENQHVTMQLYETNGAKLLLVYDCSSEEKKEQFSGWLGQNALLYRSVVQNVKIYEVSGAHPIPLEIRDTHHTSFKDLPIFMCKALSDCSFDITAYRHQDELNLIFGDEGILSMLRSQHAADESKLELVNKMQSIIQTCIAKKGDIVSIAPTPAEDQVLKDGMNQLCPRESMDPFIAKLETFLAGISGSPAEKEATYSRLGFLFGQLAKKGVLGYHHANNNTANNLFYTLSATCFQKLSSGPTLSNTARQALLRSLDEGQCIEQITHNFFIDHPDVAEIWGRV